MLTVCGGNRTRKGADTQQVLASVVRTARQRKLDLSALFATMLCAPEPIVPDVFGLPPPAASVQHRNERMDIAAELGAFLLSATTRRCRSWALT